VKLVIRPAAASDIEDAFGWYQSKRPALGLEFLAALRKGFSRIIENPQAYPVLHRDTRRYRLRRFPYGLFYRCFQDTVVVVACMHASRDPRQWQSRHDV
jgi:plasmid stabilization system protein ParE